MRPQQWQPPVALSPVETAIVKRVRRAKLFVFLREERHVLFSAAFQEELAQLVYDDHPQGHPPIPPAQLALATLLQAYTGVSDDEVIEATTMDRRWQLALDCLDCLDCSEPPLSKATLVAFRQRLIAHDGDRRLIERTLEVATDSGRFSPKALRAALESRPLWGAGKVEDTYHLLGHALRKAVSVLARQQGRGLAAMAAGAGAGVVGGPHRLKAAWDLDWDDPEARSQGRRAVLGAVLGALDALEHWLALQPEAADPAVQASCAAAVQVRVQDGEDVQDGQDGEDGEDGEVVAVGAGAPAGETAPPVGPRARRTPPLLPQLRRGVSRDRRISIEDPQMRHGRTSRSVRVDGYKRQVLHDLDSGLVCAVGGTPANAPAASVTDALDTDRAAQQVGRQDLRELHLDRAYLSSRWVRDRPEALALYCTAWPVHNGSHFPKTAFPRRPSRWIGRARPGAVRPRWSCRLCPAARSTSPLPRVPPAPCRRAVPPVRAAAASASTPMNASWPSCASANTRQLDGPSSASG
jgi:Transposase domain (DUF772)